MTGKNVKRLHRWKMHDAPMSPVIPHVRISDTAFQRHTTAYILLMNGTYPGCRSRHESLRLVACIT